MKPQRLREESSFTEIQPRLGPWPLQFNTCLIENQKVYQQRIKEFEEMELKSAKERDDKIADLEEQVRDFILFIEAQKVLGTSSNGAELRDGSVLALPATLAPSNSSTRSVRVGKKKR